MDVMMMKKSNMERNVEHYKNKGVKLTGTGHLDLLECVHQVSFLKKGWISSLSLSLSVIKTPLWTIGLLIHEFNNTSLFITPFISLVHTCAIYFATSMKHKKKSDNSIDCF